MTDYYTIRTDIWTMLLPDDWAERKTNDGKSLYFESNDGTKGIYIATWNLGDGDRRNAEDIATSFKAADFKSLESMRGYSWQILSETSHGTGQACVAITDCFAAANSYRAIGKILVAPPIAVRASFHDYACGDYEMSRAYFAPIIDSLKFFVEQG